MKLTTKVLAIGAVACALAVPAGGQGVPTIDVTSLAKLTDQLVEAKLQLKEQIAQNVKLDEQTRQLLEQILLLQNQIDALRNGLTLADLGVDPDSFLQDILPDFADLTTSVEAARSGDWGRVLASGDAFRGGGTVTGHVDSTFGKSGLSRDRVDTLAQSEDQTASRIGQSANVNAFMSVAAESSSEAAKDSLTRLDGLVQKIPDTGGLKEAIDLNTRVTAELGIALANVWSMEAIQTVGQGNMGVMDAATAADEEKYLRMRLEE
ncbi:type IV secretion system protein [Paracoccus sediminis]|jgi:Type IV secretion system proteins.|uniref:Type IV secretion system protein VirB5 n=1 Tax=Paracoccus sediminis TaxID=1214787 RepID=A0A238YJ79_9RHOB|nr:type IV secretion system protein [Paracoccus sediminis]SNR71316.1 type IV secretion system protein VirB5 [Paracoccus sediminis]